MSAPRPVIAGRTYLFSRRVTQRHFFLRPDAKVNQIYLYCLAEAAARFGVRLHAWLAMSNHQHVVFTDIKGNYPEFLAHLDKMIAKAMNARLERGENFWASEQPSVVHLIQAYDRFQKLLYLLLNPVAADLVEHVIDWPGAISVHATASGQAKVIQRPVAYFREVGPMPAEVALRAARLPGYEHLADAEWAKKVADAVRVEEQKHRARRAREGRRVLGRKGVLAMDPLHRPDTAAPRGKRRPRVACKNREMRTRVLEDLKAFRAAHRTALRQLIARERGVVFPAGTYRVRRFGVRCADLPAGATEGLRNAPLLASLV